jgi:general secretion pathway protein C
MSKYYYLTIGAIAGLLIIAFAILSQIDKTLLNPSKAPSATAKSDVSSKISKQPYHILSSKAPDDSISSLLSPATKIFKDKPLSSNLLNLRLVGTTIWGEKSSVIIEDLTKGTQGFYRLGDTIKEFKITKILKDSATLTKEDQELILKLAKGGAPLQSGEFVRKIDKDSWMLSGDKLTEMVSDINQYAGQVFALQHYENGAPAGFLIRHLKQGNDFEKMGIENGDIIKKVNGLEVNDLPGVLKAIYKLGDDTTFHLDVERNGQSKTLNYQLDKSVNPLVPIISNMLNVPLGSKKP